MNSRTLWRVGALGVVLASMASIALGVSSSEISGSDGSLSAARGAGMRVFRDPVTGAFIPEGAAGTPPASPQAGVGRPTIPTSREYANAVPGGGVVVDLGTEYMTTVRARLARDAEAKGATGIALDCGPGSGLAAHPVADPRR